MTILSALRQDIARSLDDMMVLGVVTAATSNSVSDTNNFLWSRADAILDHEVYIYGGTATIQGTAQARIGTAYKDTPYKLYVPPWTLVPAVGDRYELHKRFRVADYNKAIEAAHNAVRLKHLFPKVDEGIILGNIVPNGLMANWDDASTLTGWGAGGTGPTLARESSLIYSKHVNARSAKLTNQASQAATLSIAVPEGQKYGGESLTVRAWVYCATASRLRTYVVYLDADGNVQTERSSYHPGTGWNDADDIEISSLSLGERQQVITDANALRVGIEIASGTSIDVYLGRFEARCAAKDLLGTNIYEYDIPSGFVSIGKVWIETGTHNVFKRLSKDKDWYVVPDATRRIGFYAPHSRRAIRIIGQRKATKPTDDSHSIELNEEFIKAYACAELLKMKPQPNEAGLLAYWQRQADVLEREKIVHMTGEPVETVG